ncbi:hypothetical protein Asp14428_15900 [Actinoplanes sp. NBRC 14428]|nr:hypothetical protein Asp14428_15900 [Actinoplanes sp. NBRC 14428]
MYAGSGPSSRVSATTFVPFRAAEAGNAYRGFRCTAMRVGAGGVGGADGGADGGTEGAGGPGLGPAAGRPSEAQALSSVRPPIARNALRLPRGPGCIVIVATSGFRCRREFW